MPTALLADRRTRRVTIYDNFTSGRDWHYAEHHNSDRLVVVRAGANNVEVPCEAMADHDLVIHLASNPDIAAAMANPAIDFDQGTLLTHHVVDAMRRTGVPRIAYASGSGVYGDLCEVEGFEDDGPLEPVVRLSTTGLRTLGWRPTTGWRKPCATR